MLNKVTTAVGLALVCVPAVALANTGTLSNPAMSVVLDGHYQDGEYPLGEREDGFGFREIEFAASAAIDSDFYGKLTLILEEEDELELELEEAFIQTLSLPAGFSVRAGRFLSDIGYLNSQHLHTDAFVERPIAYRAFFGNHYFDDGLRVNWVAPTDLFWTLGAEAFDGGSLVAEGVEDPDTVGVYHLYTKLGGDIGQSQSWQLGLSYLRNENALGTPEEHEEHDEEEEGEEHEEHGHEEEEGHSHEAAFTGRDVMAVDVVYKWAPNGNFKYNHLTLSGEYFLLDELYQPTEESTPDDANGWYLSAVYQINPKWSVGARYGELDAFVLEEDEGEIEAEDSLLEEAEFMVAYHPSHFSSIRLQYTNLDGEGESFEDIDDDIVTLLFTMTLGAHGAHQF